MHLNILQYTVSSLRDFVGNSFSHFKNIRWYVQEENFQTIRKTNSLLNGTVYTVKVNGT